MLKSAWLWVSGFLLGILAVLWALIFRRVRINKEAASTLYDLVCEEGRAFIIQNELISHGMLPTIYHAICWYKGIPFRFLSEERMLRAGHSGTDSVVTITILRWQLSRLLRVLEEKNFSKEVSEIPIYILRVWDADKIGKLKIPDEISPPYLDLGVYEPVKTAIGEVVAGTRLKVGVLLHGPPGNGKSYLARYFAFHFRLPIYLIAFTPEMNNRDIIKMFSHLRGPAIVLFEDFDSYFDGRKCLMDKADFTFDTILNVLDGTYATMDGIATVMTCNMLSRVDPALRNRPGRFRYILELSDPTAAIRHQVFAGYPDSDQLVVSCQGWSLDQLLAKRETLDDTKEQLCP